jgi:hypothetical protein
MVQSPSQKDTGAGFIWAESKSTHRQWQQDISDFSSHCPKDISLSSSGVVKIFQKALSSALVTPELTDAPKRSSAAAAAIPPISMAAKIDKVGSLELVVKHVMAELEEEYSYRFLLAPKEVAKIDELESKLADAFEKIQELEIQVKVPKKKQTTAAYASLSAASATGNGSVVSWNGQTTGPAVRTFTPSHFALSGDQRILTVLRRGLYQVHVRLGQTNNGNTASLLLRLNGGNLAQCVQSDGSNHQNTPQITEIVMLEAGSALTVVCGANGNSLGDILKNRFSVLLLEELEADESTKFLSLSAASATANGSVVTWNGETSGPAVRALSPTLYEVSANNQTITVLSRGLYQVHVRLGQTNSANTQSLLLRVNGEALAQCVQSDGNGHQNTAQITEIAMLEAGSALTVVCGANSNSLGDALKTRFSILKLQDPDDA